MINIVLKEFVSKDKFIRILLVRTSNLAERYAPEIKLIIGEADLTYVGMKELFYRIKRSPKFTTIQTATEFAKEIVKNYEGKE